MKSSTLFILIFILFITDLNQSFSEITTPTNSKLTSNNSQTLNQSNLTNKIKKVASVAKIVNSVTIRSDEHLSNESIITKQFSKTLNKQEQLAKETELLNTKKLNTTIVSKLNNQNLNTSSNLSTKKIDECSKFKFDYLILSLYWSVNVCSKKACILNSPQRWFILHLSPAIQSTQFLNKCCSKKPLNTTELGTSVETELKEYWQSVSATKPDEEFWSEEWTKVGTCFERTHVVQLNTINKYFSETVRLFKEIQIQEWLKENANIIPQNDTNKLYKFDSFYNAIYQKRPFKFQITCNTLSIEQKTVSIIDRINFCLDKNLNKMNCPSTLKSNCNEYILYPTLEADLTEKKI